MTVRILQGDVLEVLPTLPACSVQCVVTSPPYYGLRDYGTAKWEGGDPDCKHNPQRPDGGERENRTLPLGRGGVYNDICRKCGALRIDSQIGLEETPEAYVEKLVRVFREVRRVLKDDGTLWLNLGDSYATNPGNGRGGESVEGGKPHRSGIDKTKMGYKPKDLIGIPWMVAFALRADGWYLRQDIIWHKPNPMPESVTDRCTKAHEYIFLLTKSARYYYDAEAVKEPAVEASWENRLNRQSDKSFPTNERNGVRTGIKFGGKKYGESDDPKHQTKSGEEYVYSGTRNKRSVWTVTTKPYKEAHFATFPPDLIEPCILAGSRVGDTVLDPFNGSGTTGAVSIKHGREYVGVELNPDYVKLTERRLFGVQPVLNLGG